MSVTSARGWDSMVTVGGATAVEAGGIGVGSKSSFLDLMLVWSTQFGLLQFVQRPIEVFAHLHDLQLPFVQAQQQGVCGNRALSNSMSEA
jgi:hypothetical protein